MSMSQLDTKCLILNRNWYPYGTNSVREVMNVIAKGHADILDENLSCYSWDEWVKLPVVDHDDTIGLSSGRVRTPRVIKVKTYGEIPKNTVKFSRGAIFARDKYFCSYCVKKFPKSILTLDHIIPKSRGGKMEWTNITTACLLCNGRKGNMTPEEAGMKLKQLPFKPSSRDIARREITDRIHPQWLPFIKELV